MTFYRIRTSIAGLLLALLLAVSLATSAQAREVPIGLYNVNNSVLNSASYRYAIRFVIDRDVNVYRFYSGFKDTGGGYSAGTAGEITARLVTIKANGEPDLTNIVAQEQTVGIRARIAAAKSLHGIGGTTQLPYFNFGGVHLNAGQMYAVVYQNVTGSPSVNWVSVNSPDAKETVAGPNGINNLDPNAAGAIAGLDPREAVAWSQDSGTTWKWGHFVGQGNTPGSYTGAAGTDDDTRLPWYGWQEVAGGPVYSNQPYYAYTATGSYTLRLANAPRNVTLTVAGGYAPVGSSVGVVTVTNTRTGQVGTTSSLGTGLARGALTPNVVIAAGDTYTIRNSGTVTKAEGDEFIVKTMGAGGSLHPFTTDGQGSDVAQVFALPDPYLTQGPPPTPPPDPEAVLEGITDGETLSGSISEDAGDRHVVATVTNLPSGVSVSRVDFEIDGVLNNSEVNAPYSLVLRDPSVLSPGVHTVQARVVPSSGAEFFSQAVNFNIAAPPVPACDAACVQALRDQIAAQDAEIARLRLGITNIRDAAQALLN